MARDRFLIILSFFYLSDDSEAKMKNHLELSRSGRLKKKEEKKKKKKKNCSTSTKILFQDLSADESMIPFKQRTGPHAGTPPPKKTKWSLKAWGLGWLTRKPATSATGPRNGLGTKGIYSVEHEMFSFISMTVQNNGHR